MQVLPPRKQRIRAIVGQIRMRKSTLAVAISLGVHALVIGWLATRPRVKPAPPVDTTPIEIVTIDPEPTPDKPVEPVEPDKPDEPVETPAATAPPARTPAPAPAPAPSKAVVTAAAPAAINDNLPSNTQPGTGTGSAGPSGDATGGTRPGRSALSMRHGELPRPALPAGRWDDLDNAPKGTAPEQVAHSGMLFPAGGGDFESDQGTFVARVRPDGTTELSDARNLRAAIALPRPSTIARGLGKWLDSDKGRYGGLGDRELAKSIQASGDSDLAPRNKQVIVPVIGGSFDVTDWLMRSHGQDPYASKKLAFLDATRDERAQIGEHHRSTQLAMVGQIMQRNLAAIGAAKLSPLDRRRALFELWDECTESGDAEVLAASNAARRLVIGYIRAHHPADGPDAYTAEELAELTRRQQSKAAFRPYE